MYICDTVKFTKKNQQHPKKRRLQNLQIDSVPTKRTKIETNLHRKFDEAKTKLIDDLIKKEEKLANHYKKKIKEFNFSDYFSNRILKSKKIDELGVCLKVLRKENQ